MLHTGEDDRYEGHCIQCIRRHGSMINDQRRRTGEDAHVFQLTMFSRRGGEFSDDKVATITTQPTS